MLSLAGPVVLAELGWVAMGTVDTMMVGRVSAEAIGAVSLGSMFFLAVAIFGMGLLLGLDTLVSQAFGAGDLEDCHRCLFHGSYLSLFLAPLLMVVTHGLIAMLGFWGTDPEVVALTEPYASVVILSLPPLLLYATFRRYLQAQGLVKPIMVVLVSANLVNALVNWMLIFGNLGAPALGVVGAGWATFISRSYMAAGLLIIILYNNHRRRTGLFGTSFQLKLSRMKKLLGLGFPAAGQVTLEFGVFAAATALASKLDPISLAAHQVALTAASITFMVPLGISSAGAVRVGQALGRGQPRAAAIAGWTALVLGAGFMLLAAAGFIFAPEQILSAFTTEPAVMTGGISLLFVAAFFQLFDGVQVVATGILRGTGDTRIPMLSSLVGHWLLGLPVGVILCFVANRGVVGLWVGLSIGLIFSGIVLVFAWSRRIKVLYGVSRTHNLELRTQNSELENSIGRAAPEFDGTVCRRHQDSLSEPRRK
jgi:MATE family multidrug resistance protein